LKEEAFDLYAKGQYEDSLDVFRRYLLSNKDDKEWMDILFTIFTKETEKIFSGVLSFNKSVSPGLAIHLQAYISFEEILSKVTPYPQLLKTLIQDFEKNFSVVQFNMNFLIAVFDKDWQKAKELLEGIRMFFSADINSSFKHYVTVYLNKKLGITDDNFDNPFEEYSDE
jgi:hypothetical protein